MVQGDLVHNNAVTLRANVAPRLVGNFFTLNLRSAREAFEQAPWVRVAQVRREFPATLHVVLQEHQAAAHWGPESDTTMVNRQGEVFDANADEAEYEGLPRLSGPNGQSAQVLWMQGQLQKVFEPLGMVVQALDLSNRGGWHLELDSGATVELGGERPMRCCCARSALCARSRRCRSTMAGAPMRWNRPICGTAAVMRCACAG